MLEKLNDIKQELSKLFPKDGLKYPLAYWILDFIRLHGTLYVAKGLNDFLILAKTVRKRFSHDESVLLYASVFADKEIFDLFFAYIPTHLQKAFRRLAEVGKISGAEMTELTGLQQTDSHLKIFPTNGYHSWNNHYFLPPKVRKSILVYLDYFKFDLTPVQQLEKTDVVYYSTDYVFKEIPILATYIQQNEIVTTQQGRPTSATLKKIVKTTKIEEFYTKEKGMNATIKTLFLLNLILELPRNKLNNIKGTESILEHLLKGIYIKKNRNSILDLFFSHKGLYKYNLVSRNIENDILNKLKKLPIKEWLSFENVFNFLHQECDIFPIEVHTAQSEIYQDIHYYGKGVVENPYLEYVQKPFVKGTFFLFAALGMMDIAYDNDPEVPKFKHDTPNPYDKLKYIRLNEFGAYLLGLNKGYTPPKIEENNEFYISSEALIITVNEENTTAEIILKNYMHQVSATRYMTDYQRFLSDCNSIRDIETKIIAFKKSLNLTFPQNWEIFFKEIIDKTNRFKEAFCTVYEVENDPELIRLIARDEELKKWVVKAENYHILVKNSHLVLFKNRLLKFGYFLK
jgi:hypothetical protein